MAEWGVSQNMMIIVDDEAGAKKENYFTLVVQRLQCVIPFGSLFRYPVVYYLMLSHIECVMLWDLCYTTSRCRPVV